MYGNFLRHHCYASFIFFFGCFGQWSLNAQNLKMTIRLLNVISLWCLVTCVVVNDKTKKTTTIIKRRRLWRSAPAVNFHIFWLLLSQILEAAVGYVWLYIREKSLASLINLKWYLHFCLTLRIWFNLTTHIRRERSVGCTFFCRCFTNIILNCYKNIA